MTTSDVSVSVSLSFRRQSREVSSDVDATPFCQWATRVDKIGYTLQPHPIADDAQASPTSWHTPNPRLMPHQAPFLLSSRTTRRIRNNADEQLRTRVDGVLLLLLLLLLLLPIGHCDVIVYGRHESVSS